MNAGRATLSHLESTADPLEDNPRWQLVLKIVASRHFVRATLLSQFLMYICSETLQGRGEEITEYQIGIHVFRRPRNYRTVEDNIVRNYARQLRKRLAEYFAGEGQGGDLSIEIPLGGYVPEFKALGQTDTSTFSPDFAPGTIAPKIARTPVLVEDVPEPIPIHMKPPARVWWRRAWFRLILFTAYSVLVAGGAAAVVLYFKTPHRGADPIDTLWSSLFKEPLDTFIVPADCGFNILEDLSKKHVDLGGYLRGDYLELPLPTMDEHSRSDLRSQEFTSFVDLQVVSGLARLPQVDPRRLFVRFPRDLRLDDLKSSNVIVIGSVGSNPWAEILQRNLNFRIEYSSEMQQAEIVNSKPQPGEAAEYRSLWNEPAHPTYAVIAYQPNLSGNGHMLLIEGLDVAGTQAAAEALLKEATLEPVLRMATGNNGEIRPFEALLQSASIESNAASAHVLAYRIE